MTTKHAALSWRAALALAFVLLQGLLVLRARFVEDRFFAWAPHDRQVEYRLSASVNGTALSSDELVERYGLLSHGWLSHASEDAHWTITTREARLPLVQRASVTLASRVNGHPWQTWTCP